LKDAADDDGDFAASERGTANKNTQSMPIYAMPFVQSLGLPPIRPTLPL
jgi:hypothetical protein